MKTPLLHKVVAGLGVAMLLTMNASNFLVANAANISTLAVTGGTGNATAVTAITFTPVTPLTSGSTIVVSYPAAFTDAGLVLGDVAADNAVGGGDFVAGTIVVDTAANTITVPVTTVTTGASPVTLTLSNAHLKSPASAAASLASFTVSTSVGDAGATIVSVNSGDTVAVTATVLPTLTLSIDSNTLAFGTLSAGSVTTAQSGLAQTYVQVGIATNANGGAAVTLTSGNNGALKDGGKTIPAQASALIAGTAGVAYHIGTVSGASAGATSTITTGTYVDLTSPAVVLNTNNKPTVTQTAQIIPTATISAITPAGNYTDTLTITAAGTF